MLSLIWRSTLMTLALGLLLCGAYPAFVTLVATGFFPEKAAGSLVRAADGKILGSRLLGQGFSKPEYFQSRPSAAGEKGYDAASSSGSNLGPTSKKLIDGIAANVKAVLDANPGSVPGSVPVDLVTASGSGLDPHISPAAAQFQAARVAKARGISVEHVQELIVANTESAFLGFIGQPAVNVLMLNLDLDAKK